MSEAARDQGWYASKELREEAAERALRRLRDELAEEGEDDGRGLDALAAIRATVENAKSRTLERLVSEAAERKSREK